MAGDDRLAWEKQKGESRQAFEAFATYRDMRNRSIRKVAVELAKNLELIGRWSSHWGWARRVEAYDMDQDRQLRERHQQALEEMTDRHVSQALMLQNVVIGRLQALFTADGEPTPELAKLGAGSLARMLETAVSIERTARGQASERIAIEHPAEAAVPRDAELARRIAGDPSSRFLATELLARVAGEEPLDPGALGLLGDPGPVDSGETPPVDQPGDS